MNPIVLDIGPLELHAFTAWLWVGVLLALAILIVRAYQYGPARLTRWLDAGIAAVAGGVIGARALHVIESWDYFRDHMGDITDLASGGLGWHGALAGGLLAALVVARLRGLSWAEFRAWTDAVALAWPVGLIMGWLACRHNGCAYGYEVRTLADWPGWMVEELPDVYGLIAPRLDVQLGGAAVGVLLLALAALLTWRGWLPGLRLWLILALTGFALALLGFFRADPAPTLLDRRADQVYDLGVLLGSTLIGVWLWLRDHRAPDVPDESNAPRIIRSPESIRVEKYKL